MKKILIVAIFFLSIVGFAQIKGNENIITRAYNADKIEVIKINLYAKVIIDCNIENEIRIKADENLMKFIGKKVKNGVLSLNQLEWIQASEKIEITIGAPYLKELITGTHGTTFVENFKNEALKIFSPIGNIKVNGTTKFLTIDSKNGNIDASKLTAENASITISGSSKTNLKVINTLKSKLSKNARFQLVNTPLMVLGDAKKINLKSNLKVDVEWINIKIKNNSWNRHGLVVVGPKKDGSQFSYGFAMMPGVVKKVRWSVGSKIYKNTSFGTRKLLVTITKEFEDRLIKIFQD